MPSNYTPSFFLLFLSLKYTHKLSLYTYIYYIYLSVFVRDRVVLQKRRKRLDLYHKTWWSFAIDERNRPFMDSTSSEGFVQDSSKDNKSYMDQKIELVYEISDWSEGAPDLLQSWNRQEILQILQSETGKDKKYTGLTKLKIIEILLKVVSDKKSQRATKKQRNNPTDNNDYDLSSNEIKLCKNLACKAKLGQDDEFCKRCSCCICHEFDDNKDPSLWLVCGSESCGLSCHLECVFQHEKSGISKDGENRALDGSFYCVTCGKVNDLLQCWRKQMTIARDTRVVDILCYRVSLAQKLLTGTVIYENLDKIVSEIIEKLKADVGPLTGLPVKRARGIINRLASGQEVQRLCAFAVESLDSVISNTHDPVVKDSEKVKKSQSQSLPTNSGSLSYPSSVEDENNNVVGNKDTNKKQTYKRKKPEKINGPDDVKTDLENGKESDQEELPFTPCKEESSKDETLPKNPTPEPSKDNLDNGSSKKRDDNEEEEGQDRDFGYYVKIIRWLECEKHIDKSFRQKFLTWYSLRAGPQEVRIVKVFVDTLMEDPALLAEQLVDTFSEVITSKKCSKGLCLKLFH